MFMKVVGSGSSGNTYIIESNGQTLLLDCGCKWKDILKAMDYNVLDCVACVVSHRHNDHSKAYKEVLYAGIPIYTNDETSEHFGIISGEKMIGVPEMKRIKVGCFSIIPFYIPHTTRDVGTGTIIDCPNYGYLIEADKEKLLFMTDFLMCKYVFKSLKINHFLIECNHNDELVDADSIKYEHSIRGHSSLSTVKEFLKVNKTDAMRNVILCHLSRDAADEKKMQKEVIGVVGEEVNVKIACKNLILEL